MTRTKIATAILMTFLYACGGAAVSINEGASAPLFSGSGSGGIVPGSNPGNIPGTIPERSCTTTFSINTYVEGPGNLAESFLLVQSNTNSFLVRQDTNCPFPVLQALPTKYYVYFFRKESFTNDTTLPSPTPDYILMLFINEVGFNGKLKVLDKDHMEFSVTLDGHAYNHPTCAFRFEIETATLKSPGALGTKTVSIELSASAKIILQDETDIQNCAGILRPSN